MSDLERVTALVEDARAKMESHPLEALAATVDALAHLLDATLDRLLALEDRVYGRHSVKA